MPGVLAAQSPEELLRRLARKIGQQLQRELAELEGKGVSPGKQRKGLRVIDGGD